MEITPDHLSDAILMFCLHRPPVLESTSFSLLDYFAKKVADVAAARDGFGFVEAEKGRVAIAITELERDKYISSYGNNYLLTTSGRNFATLGGYAGQRLREMKKERTIRVDRWVTRGMAGVALIVSIIALVINYHDTSSSQSVMQPILSQQPQAQKQIDSLGTLIDTSTSMHQLQKVRH